MYLNTPACCTPSPPLAKAWKVHTDEAGVLEQHYTLSLLLIHSVKKSTMSLGCTLTFSHDCEYGSLLYCKIKGQYRNRNRNCRRDKDTKQKQTSFVTLSLRVCVWERDLKKKKRKTSLKLPSVTRKKVWTLQWNSRNPDPAHIVFHSLSGQCTWEKLGSSYCTPFLHLNTWVTVCQWQSLSLQMQPHAGIPP